MDKQLLAVMQHRAVTVNQSNADTKTITIHQKRLKLCRAESRHDSSLRATPLTFNTLLFI